MSDAKTKVTHTGDRARFLGYDITVSRSQNLRMSTAGYKLRSNTGVVKLLVPREKWVNKLLEYNAIKIKINENGKERFVALHRGKLVNWSDIEILTRYNAEVRGLYNYYSIANDSFKIGKFANLMKYSMYKTFACKYKTNVHEIKCRYCVGDLFTVPYETKTGTKTTTFYRDGFKRKETATKFDNVSELPQYTKYGRTNTLYSQTRSNTQRALMQPDEIQRMDNKQCIVLLRGQKPMLLYKIIPDEFSAFQRLRPTPVGEHIPEWRKHLSSAPEVKAEAPKQEAPPPPPKTKPGSESNPKPEKKEQRGGPEPELEYDFTCEDGGLGMVEKTVSSMLGEDEPEEEDYGGRIR